MPANKKTNISETHQARFEVPRGLWLWICSEADAKTRGNLTAFIVSTLEQIKNGDMISRSVFDERIRKEEEKVALAER